MTKEGEPSEPSGAPYREPAAAPSGLLARVLRETTRFAFWQTVGSGLTFGVYIVLARLLERRDLGVYGICSFYLGVGSLLGDAGMGAALLRLKQEPTREQWRSTFTATLLLALALTAALALGAPWLAARNGFTAQEAALLRSMSPLYLVGALRMLPYVRLERALSFERLARIELAASLVRHALAVAIAVGGGHAWALVLANVAQACVQLGLAWRASPGWVGLGLRWSVLGPLSLEGFKLQALGICAFFKDNLSRALLGQTLGPSAVGLFDFGQNYIQLPVVAVNALARVQLPVYSRKDRRDEELGRVVTGTLRAAFLLGLPMLLAQAWAGSWLLPRLYDPRWLDAMPVVWGLWGNMAAGLLASPLFTLLQAQGYAGRAVLLFLAWSAGTWALVLAAMAFGAGSVGAVASCYSALTVLVVLGLLRWASRHLGRPLERALAAPALGLLAGLALPWLATRAGWLAHPLARAGLSVGAFAAVVLALEGRRVVADLRGLSGTASAPESPPPAAPPP